MLSVPSINLSENSLRSLAGLSLKFGVVFVLAFVFHLSSLSQSPGDLEKLSPRLKKEWQNKNATAISIFIVAVKENAGFKKLIGDRKNISIVSEYAAAKIFVVKANWTDVLKFILPLDQV